MRKKEKIKHDPNEIQGLLDEAQKGDLEARDKLVSYFQPFLAGLVGVCLKGRYWSSYQSTFLSLFASQGTPLIKVALMLKRNLREYDKKDLNIVAQEALLMSIERCQKNLCGTTVYIFKDLVSDLIKEKGIIDYVPFYSVPENIDNSVENTIHFNLFINSLTSEEFEMVDEILAGEKVKKVPDSLKEKFKEYYGT